MKRKRLIKEIIKFSLEYGLFNNGVKTSELESMIEIWLKDTRHVESLINTIIKTSYHQNVDKQNLKTLLLELEKIRLDLEYKE